MNRLSRDSSSFSSSKAQQQVPSQVQDLYCFSETGGILTTTMSDVPGYRVVKVLGAVYGLTVRSRNWAAGIGMVLKSVAGGELRWFTSMLYEARNDAVGRVVSEAQNRGANAIICLRFDCSDMEGFAQVCAYGTAAIIEKVDHRVADIPQLA